MAYRKRGLSMAEIAEVISVSERTVRRILGKGSDAKRPLCKPTKLDAFDGQIRLLLKEDGGISVRTILAHLRGSGYTGGLSQLITRISKIRMEPYLTRYL
jgi:DNA-binding CsgD family transcriptional regulator